MSGFVVFTIPFIFTKSIITMLRKTFLIILISTIAFLNAKAQDEKLIYYMNSNDVPVKEKDGADYIRAILPPNAHIDTALFVVKDFYKDGKPKMVGLSIVKSYRVKLEGSCFSYYPNGNLQSKTYYENGIKVGKQTDYYPNGNLYRVIDMRKSIITECRDSTGKILVKKGKGYYIGYTTDFKRIFEQGRVVDSLKDGEWHGQLNDTVKFVCVYEKGIIKQGTSYGNKGAKYLFTAIEVEPSFKGGVEKLYRFLGQYIRYLDVARDNNIQGKIFLSFIIEKDGSLTNIKVIRGLGYGLDEETVRVFKRSPKWNPGLQYGVPVRMMYTFPIVFALQNGNL